jgi:catechol 2,3-dioxygenase-like lactoylglutathione lyase family enzyme
VIGRLHHVILDTPDPAASADFWSAVLGQPVTYRSPDFCVVAANDTSSGLGFQLAPDHVPPSWPDQPVRMHLDVMTDDVEDAGRRVVELGARHLADTVYADPAGHPFCLIPRPSWAPAVTGRRSS